MLTTGCGGDMMQTMNDNINGIIANDAAEECSSEAEYYAEDEEQPEFNTEEYNAITENSFKSTVSDPLSTFSIDVDTASYSNVRRMIQAHQDVPAGAVRIEEMLNYFHYDYPQPNADEPFSVTTQLADCPWNADTKLMRVGLHAKDIDLSQRKPMNLVFLIDVSGSMYEVDKLPLVQKSFSILTETLDQKDRISIVTYADGDAVVLEGANGGMKDDILDAINSLHAGGSTAGAAGINTAYEIAERNFIEGGNNRIILATDGDLNVGVSSEDELKRLVEEKREGGVLLSVLGFGTGNIKDNKMETLADNGNGSYAYIDSVNEAKKVLVEEMGGTFITVAKDVKIQVEFNPAYIKGYRLIGYENRALSAEDFADDTKDAGEIGAGHTVTALYEIADNASTMTFDSADLKYSDEAAQGSENGEYLTVSVRYKKPDENESNLLAYPVTEDAYAAEMSNDMRFAAAVAEFGMLLRDSSYKGNATKQTVLDLLSGCDLQDDVYKTEFVDLVKESRIS
ncbi:MAG TPA: VWA domain-containing protein [Ruminococcus sp.]|nr:VWA domain-containing protein [Ruminococcus sp.]